jgi:polyhydroxyalkanoate synthesis regulator phasin
MNPFEMVVIIVLIVTLGGVIKQWVGTRHRLHDMEDQLRKSGVSEQLQRIDQLEERVRTLERIVTDRAERLRNQIDSL